MLLLRSHPSDGLPGPPVLPLQHFTQDVIVSRLPSDDVLERSAVPMSFTLRVNGRTVRRIWQENGGKKMPDSDSFFCPNVPASSALPH